MGANLTLVMQIRIPSILLPGRELLDLGVWEAVPRGHQGVGGERAGGGDERQEVRAACKCVTLC